MKYFLVIVIVLFFILYFAATFLYPGGHHLDYNALEFNWIHNYWCDLYAEGYYNDRSNDAMDIAIGATILVALGIGHFFYIYPNYIKVSPLWTKLIRICGVMTALTMIPVFIDRFHSLSIIVASIFGLVVLIGVIKSIWNNNMTRLFTSGWIGLLLIIISNVMYYLQLMVEWLPLVQKVAFVVVLIWLCLLNLSFGEKIKA